MKKGWIVAIGVFLCSVVCGNAALASIGSDGTIDGSDYSKAVSQVVEKAMPAVVFIAKETNWFTLAYGENPSSFYEMIRPFYEWMWPTLCSHGSGFIVTPDGYIVTNAHVIKDSTSILVGMQIDEFRVMKATVIGKDSRSDIAVLKLDNPNNEAFPFLKFGNSNTAKVGEPVIAIGTPVDSYLEGSVTTGVISAKERNDLGILPIESFIQTDTAINGGNSGGPLINLRGEVIGINTAKFASSRIEGLAFVIPSHTAKNVSRQLIEHQKVTPGFLGICLEKENETPFNVYALLSKSGARVVKVRDGSSAQKAGLQIDDCILAVNDYPVDNAMSLRNQLTVREAGEMVILKVLRNGAIFSLSIVLEEDKALKVLASYSYIYDTDDFWI